MRTQSRQRLALPHPGHSSRREAIMLSRVRLCALQLCAALSSAFSKHDATPLWHYHSGRGFGHLQHPLTHYNEPSWAEFYSTEVGEDTREVLMISGGIEEVLRSTKPSPCFRRSGDSGSSPLGLLGPGASYLPRMMAFTHFSDRPVNSQT